MPTNTTTFSFNKPVVGGDDDAWGGYLNTNWDTVDDLLDGTTPIQPNLTEGSWQIGGTAITTTAAELNELGDFAGVFTLPSADGTSGQAIVTDGAGALSFADAGGFFSTRSSPDGVTVIDNIAFAESLNGLIFTTDDIDQASFDNKYWGSHSIFIGSLAGPLLGGNVTSSSMAIGADSVGIGRQALSQAIGRTSNYVQQKYGFTTTDGNVAIGGFAQSSVTTGSANTAVGFSALGASTLTGDNNICIGFDAGVDANFNFGSNQSASNRVVIGDNGITNAYIKVSWTVTSDERDKTDFAPLTQGLDVVDEIETYTFKFDNRSSYYVYDEDRNVIDRPNPDGTHKTERTFVGFKAQQVEQVLNSAGFPENIAVDNEDPENYKMKETALIPLLINAIKELKQRVETLEQGA